MEVRVKDVFFVGLENCEKNRAEAGLARERSLTALWPKRFVVSQSGALERNLPARVPTLG